MTFYQFSIKSIEYKSYIKMGFLQGILRQPVAHTTAADNSAVLSAEVSADTAEAAELVGTVADRCRSVTGHPKAEHLLPRDRFCFGSVRSVGPAICPALDNRKLQSSFLW